MGTLSLRTLRSLTRAIINAMNLANDEDALAVTEAASEAANMVLAGVIRSSEAPAWVESRVYEIQAERDIAQWHDWCEQLETFPI